MNIAYDPVTKRCYIVNEWIKNCDNRRDGECIICWNDVYLRADKTTERLTHFCHKPGANCPTIRENHDPFKHLTARAIDRENGERIKRYIADHAYSIYSECHTMAPGLHTKEFRIMIKKADECRVWYYKGLMPYYLPFVLLTCLEMFKKSDGFPRGHRLNNFYFAFDPSVTSVQNLWNLSKKSKRILWKIPASGHTSSCMKGKIERYQIPDRKADFSKKDAPSWFASTQSFINQILGYGI